MTLPVTVALASSGQMDHDCGPPAKRPRTAAVQVANASIEVPRDADSSLVRRHPLGVRPSGNALTASKNLKTACGHFAVLPDELLAQSLEYLEASDVLRLGGTCKALYAFSRNEELWRTIFVE